MWYKNVPHEILQRKFVPQEIYNSTVKPHTNITQQYHTAAPQSKTTYQHQIKHTVIPHTHTHTHTHTHQYQSTTQQYHTIVPHNYIPHINTT